MFREFNLEDSDTIATALNDEEVSRWTSNIPFPYTENDAISWIESHKLSAETPLAIEVDKQLVGCISYWPMDVDTTEIGYWIDKAFWGKGIATKALTHLISNSVFPNKPKIAAKVSKQNIGSQRVLEKCGFVISEECQVLNKGEFQDAFLYTKANLKQIV